MEPQTETSQRKIALVTGASGFIAGHLVKRLLENGYEVRGTVRNLGDKTKTEHLRKMFPKLHLYEANLLKEGSFDEAAKGCTFIFHTASPFQLQVEDPQRELNDPAVIGTLNVLKCAEKISSVKRVVLTSSVAAIVPEWKATKVFTEDDWNTFSDIKDPYRYSKKLAEEAAWKFSKGKHFDLVAINPGFILGPPLSARTDSTSIKEMKGILEGDSTQTLPALAFPIVDVRDVAEAHLLGAQIPSAQGRYILGTEMALSYLDLFQILHKSGKFGSYAIPLKEQSTPEKVQVSNQKVQKELGLIFRPVEETMIDMVTAMENLGIIKKKAN